MIIKFDETPGYLADMLYSLFFVYNQNYKSFYKKYNFNFINPSVDEALNKITDLLGDNYEKKLFDIFFSRDYDIMRILLKDEYLWNKKNLSEYENCLNQIDDNKFRKDLINELLFDKNGVHDSNEADKILDGDIVEFISDIDIKPNAKWDIILFYDKPGYYVEKLCAYLTRYEKIYKKVLKDYSGIIKELQDFLKKEIKENGAGFVRNILNENAFAESFSEVYITALFFNSASYSFADENEKLYTFLGIDFKKTIKSLKGDSSADKNLNVLKSISDKTRYQILRYLINGECYGQELAEKLGLTMATISYHMDFLWGLDLVSIHRDGHKVYYTINKNTIKSAAVFLTESFNLD